jgi:hypothetical protein
MKPIREFQPNEIVINDQQTRQILNFFYRDAAPPVHINHVSHQLKSLAQAMLVEGIEKTKMQTAFFQSLPAGIPIIKNIALGATAMTHLVTVLKAANNVNNYIDEATPKNIISIEDLQNGKIAENIRSRLAYNLRREFDIRSNPYTAHNKQSDLPLHAMQDDPAFKNLPENMQKAVLAYTNLQDQTKLETHQTAQNTPNQFGISPSLKAQLDEEMQQKNQQSQGRSLG